MGEPMPEKWNPEDWVGVMIGASFSLLMVSFGAAVVIWACRCG